MAVAYLIGSGMSEKDYSQNPRIKVVGSLTEVFNTPYDPYNCVIFPRKLTADFNALAKGLGEQLHVNPKVRAHHDLSYHELAVRAQSLDEPAKAAADIVLADMREIEQKGLHATLRVVSPAGYKFRVAHAFHADKPKNTEHGRLLCCYTDPVTQSVRNEDATPINVEKYSVKPEAQITTFRPGDIWKQAVRNDRGILPFIHRAGTSPSGGAPRLVLEAD